MITPAGMPCITGAEGGSRVDLRPRTLSKVGSAGLGLMLSGLPIHKAFVVEESPLTGIGSTVSGVSSNLAFFFFVLSMDLIDRASELSETASLELSGELVRMEAGFIAGLDGDTERGKGWCLVTSRSGASANLGCLAGLAEGVLRTVVVGAG